MTKKKSHVKVFVRTRPTARPYEGIKTSKDGQTITVNLPKDDCLINNQLDSLTLKFDGVLENVSQDVVYETCVHDTVDSALAGYNATVFAYGQTGAGKTHTMAGDARSFSLRGVIPRAIQHVFREVDLRSDRIYAISASYLEIHNEALRDLLAPDPWDPAAAEGLAILDDAATTVVRGLTKVPVASEEEALRAFFTGEQGRSTAQHALNAASSRSHALFTLHIEMRASAEADERAVLSKLHLVDLAGSERIKKTQAAAGSGDTNYEQLRESACINKSLTFLEQVVNSLARGDAHVPFRQSKLTAALRDALGGNSNAVMIAALWPEAAHLEECVSTLRFAARVRCLQTDAALNESGDPVLALRRAERQVRELRQELAMRDMLAGRGRVAYEDLSDGERAELQQLVLRFLAGAAELDELPTDSLKRIRETYKAFKAVSSTWAAAATHADAGRVPNSDAAGQGGAAEPEAPGVGEVDATGGSGFCIGTAPLHARPAAAPPGHAAAAGPGSRGSSPAPGSSGSAAQQQQQQQRQRQFGTQSTTATAAAAAGTALGAASGAATPPDAAGASVGGPAGDGMMAAADRSALFSRYKHSVPQGVRQAELVKQQQQQLAQLKQSVKDGGVEVNAAKSDIDGLADALEAKKALAATSSAKGGSSSSDGSGGGVLDDEHYQLLQQLKAAKARYRSLYDGLAELRARCDAATDALAAAKAALLAGFETWQGSQQLPAQQAGAGTGAATAAGSLGWSQQSPSALPEGAGDPEDLDPNEVYERAALAAKAAAAGDPSSAAFFAAKKHTAKALGARRA